MRLFAPDHMDLKNIMKNSPTRLVSLEVQIISCEISYDFFAKIYPLCSSTFLEVDYVKVFIIVIFSGESIWEKQNLETIELTEIMFLLILIPVAQFSTF